jgi:hypothetical protein
MKFLDSEKKCNTTAVRIRIVNGDQESQLCGADGNGVVSAHCQSVPRVMPSSYSRNDP